MPRRRDRKDRSTAFGAALIPIVFAYGGWQNANYVAEEIKDPKRILPICLLLGTAIVALVYITINVAYLKALGLGGLAATTTPASDSARLLFGAAGDRFVTAAIAISTFGFLNLCVLAPTRVYYAMAADGAFFPQVARLHPEVPDAVARDRVAVDVGDRADAHRHLRDAARLRGVRRLDLFRAHGRIRLRVPAHDAGRAAAVQDMGLSDHAGALRDRGDRDRLQRHPRQPGAVGDRRGLDDRGRAGVLLLEGRLPAPGSRRPS